MKTARLTVLGVALVAGVAAAVLATGPKPPEIAPPPPPRVLTDDVLVAAKELNSGDVIDESGLSWEPRLKDNIREGLIRKSNSPDAIADWKGATVCLTIAPGESVRLGSLVRGSHCGSLAAQLRPGKRAVAINIDTQGSSTAGGFILPNNRVDVVHTFPDARNGNSFFSQIILSNIRVLAIGQMNQEKNGERVVTGVNATLELTPTQAETIVPAQRTGQLSLILRGMTDAKATGG